jgi:hypothetical protein
MIEARTIMGWPHWILVALQRMSDGSRSLRAASGSLKNSVDTAISDGATPPTTAGYLDVTALGRKPKEKFERRSPKA